MPKICEPHEIPLRYRFPWIDWADGQWRTLWKNEDFPNEKSRQVYDCAKNIAKGRGLGFAGHMYDDHVLIQIWHQETSDGEPATPAEPASE